MHELHSTSTTVLVAQVTRPPAWFSENTPCCAKSTHKGKAAEQREYRIYLLRETQYPWYRPLMRTDKQAEHKLNGQEPWAYLPGIQPLCQQGVLLVGARAPLQADLTLSNSNATTCDA